MSIFFEQIVAIPIVLGIVLNGLSNFMFLQVIKPKIGLTVLLLAIFTFVFITLDYQIAFDSRSEFGATWLVSGVFWELFVQQGKGFYILLTALFFKMLIYSFLSQSKN